MTIHIFQIYLSLYTFYPVASNDIIMRSATNHIFINTFILKFKLLISYSRSTDISGDNIIYIYRARPYYINIVIIRPSNIARDVVYAVM